MQTATPIHAVTLNIAVLCMLISSFTSWGAAEDGQPAIRSDSILLGQLVSRTGNNPGGRDNENGAALAAAQINAAGGLLGGRQVRILAEDDRTQADAAVAAFERLAAQHVSAVIGTSFSNASLAVIPGAERAKIPYVSTGAADAQVEPVRSFVYMTPLTGRLVAEQLLRYLQQRRVSRIAVVYDADSQFARNGWSKQKAMLASYGIDLSAERAVRVDTTDFAPAFDGISGSGAQAVMAWVTGPPAIGLAQHYARAGIPLPLFMSHGAASPAFVDAVGRGAEGITVAAALAAVAPQLPDSPTRQVALAMTQAFEKAHGHLPSQFAIDGYVAVKLICAAIEQAQSDRPTAIQAALDGLRLVTPQGEYRYSPGDHSGLQLDDVAITEIRNGRFMLTDWSKQQLAQRGSAERPSR